jgi:CDP-diacylglycerol--serine O-phosphatidyltransferase
VALLSFLQVSTVRFRSFKTLKLSPLSVLGLTLGLVMPIAAALALGQPWLMLIIFTGGYIVWGLVEHAVWLIRGSTADDQPDPSTEAAADLS